MGVVYLGRQAMASESLAQSRHYRTGRTLIGFAWIIEILAAAVGLFIAIDRANHIARHGRRLKRPLLFFGGHNRVPVLRLI